MNVLSHNRNKSGRLAFKHLVAYTAVILAFTGIVPSPTVIAEEISGSLLIEASLGPLAAPEFQNEQSAFDESAVLSSEKPANVAVTLNNKKVISGSAQRQRAIQYSEDQLVFVVLDDKGAELYRNVQTDPRLVRADLVNSTGQIQGEKHYRDNVYLTFSIPNDARATSVNIYKPVWNGSQFSFSLIGSLSID